MIAVDVDVVDGDVVVVLSPVVAAAAAGATAGTNAVGCCGLSFLRPFLPFFFLFHTIVTYPWLMRTVLFGSHSSEVLDRTGWFLFVLWWCSIDCGNPTEFALFFLFGNEGGF